MKKRGRPAAKKYVKTLVKRGGRVAAAEVAPVVAAAPVRRTAAPLVVPVEADVVAVRSI